MQLTKDNILDFDLSVEHSSQLEIEAIDVLDYVDKPEVYFLQMLGKLRYGGKLTIESNNIDLIVRNLYRDNITNINHILYNGRKSIFPLDSLIRIAEEYGYIIESIQQANYKYSIIVRRQNAS